MKRSGFSTARIYFYPSTTIRFGLPTEAPVTLEIWNLFGMKVRTLVSGERMNAAYYNTVRNGKDDAGVSVPSGVYIYRIVADKFLVSKKTTLLKRFFSGALTSFTKQSRHCCWDCFFCTRDCVKTQKLGLSF